MTGLAWLKHAKDLSEYFGYAEKLFIFVSDPVSLYFSLSHQNQLVLGQYAI